MASKEQGLNIDIGTTSKLCILYLQVVVNRQLNTKFK
jgi:hypothetical protein